MSLKETVEKYGDDGLMAMILERSITEYVDNAVAVINNYSLSHCPGLTVVDIPNTIEIRHNAFCYDSKLAALILRNPTMVVMSNTSALVGTAIDSGTGYIYVPAALVDSYKAATNWSTYADQFRALEDYTVDGTITGELDESKI